ELEGTTPEERLQRWGSESPRDGLGIEPEHVLFERAIELLNETVDRYEGKRVLLVTHGGWIVHVLRGLFPTLRFDWIGNTSLTTLIHEAGSWEAELVNCTAHISGENKGGLE